MSAQPADSASPAERAREVVMRHMAAIGGMEAYGAVQSTRTLATTRLPMGGNMRVEMWTTKPNLAYIRSSNEYMTAEAGFDGKVYWTLDSEEGAKILSRPPEMMNAAAFDPLAALARYEVKWLGVRERGGKKMDALQMTAGDGQLYTQYYDVETGLFSRLDIGNLTSPASSIRFERYKQFGALKYATVITTRVTDAESVSRIQSVDHKPVDPKRYEAPKAVRDLAARKP